MTAVAVPQQDGEIVLTNGEAPNVYSVKAGIADVPDGELAEFLANVPGSAVAVKAKDQGKPDAPIA